MEVVAARKHEHRSSSIHLEEAARALKSLSLFALGNNLEGADKQRNIRGTDNRLRKRSNGALDAPGNVPQVGDVVSPGVSLIPEGSSKASVPGGKEPNLHPELCSQLKSELIRVPSEGHSSGTFMRRCRKQGICCLHFKKCKFLSCRRKITLESGNV